MLTDFLGGLDVAIVLFEKIRLKRVAISLFSVVD